MYKLGLLGYGKMGSAIINGALSKGIYQKNDIAIFDVFKDNAINDGFKVVDSELELYESSDVVLFAVKPQSFPEVMQKLSAAKKSPKIIITIAAGITLSYLEKNLGKLPMVRIMPNLGAQIGAAVSTMATLNTTEEESKVVYDIFSSIGSVSIVEEEDINKLLALNGSYPAYFWYFVRGFINNAVKNGIDYKTALNMVCDASIGCAQMLKDSPKHIDTLINDVCSYKGTTIEGIYVFDDAKMTETIDLACDKCANRAKELEQ